MIAYQSDQQLWCQSKIFQARNWPAMKAEDRVFRSLCTEHSQNWVSRLVSVASWSGFCASKSAYAVGHMKASSCTGTASAYSHPLAAFNGQNRLILAPHARTLSRPSLSDTDSTWLVVQPVPPGNHLQTLFTTAWHSCISAPPPRRCLQKPLRASARRLRRQEMQHIPTRPPRSRSAAHNWIQQRARLLGALLHRGREPKGREFGCTPAF